MNIKETAKEIYEVNLSKGFWKEGRQIGDRDRNVGETLMLVVTELAEALEADRKGYRADEEAFDYHINFIRDRHDHEGISKERKRVEYNEAYKGAYEDHIKDSWEAEIAGTFIRLMDLCHGYGIDIEKFIRLEVDYNKLRGQKHGKLY